ncbi:hypothetical protein H0H93_012794 [Arthromyces matolae]|nr:hypothetical protein H0H93_012794 [Arthromyces matolae]
MIFPALVALILCSILVCGAPTPIPTSTSDILPNASLLFTSPNLKDVPSHDLRGLPDNTPNVILPDSVVDATRLRTALGSQSLVRRTDDYDARNAADAERYFKALFEWRQKNWTKVPPLNVIKEEYMTDGHINYIQILLDIAVLESSTPNGFTFRPKIVLDPGQREQYNLSVARKYFSLIVNKRRLEEDKKGISYHATPDDIQVEYMANGKIQYRRIIKEIKNNAITFPYKFRLSDDGTRLATETRKNHNRKTVKVFCTTLRAWYMANKADDPIVWMSDEQILENFREKGLRLDYNKIEQEAATKGLKNEDGSSFVFEFA